MTDHSPHDLILMWLWMYEPYRYMKSIPDISAVTRMRELVSVQEQQHACDQAFCNGYIQQGGWHVELTDKGREYIITNGLDVVAALLQQEW